MIEQLDASLVMGKNINVWRSIAVMSRVETDVFDEKCLRLAQMKLLILFKLVRRLLFRVRWRANRVTGNRRFSINCRAHLIELLTDSQCSTKL